MKNPAFAARGSEVDRQRAYGIAASPPTWSLHLHLSTAPHLGVTGAGAVKAHVMSRSQHMTTPYTRPSRMARAARARL